MKYKILLLILFLSFSDLVYPKEGLKFTNITIENGLSNLNATDIAEDNLGYIWIATMRGLNRYNGSAITSYFYNPADSNSINSSHINNLLSATDGNLYIGTSNGLNIFDTRLELFRNPFPSLKKMNIGAIAESNGYIYVGGFGTIQRFKPKKDELEIVGKNWDKNLILNKLFTDFDGNLWCCFDNAEGIAKYIPETDMFEFYKSESVSKELNNSVRSVYQYSKNLMILCTRDGISFFNPQTGTFVENEDFSVLRKELDNIEVQFMLEKEPSVYWIGTYRSGIIVYDKKKNILRRHLSKDFYSEVHSNSYMGYYVDKSQNVWFATFDAGVDVSFKYAKNFNFDPYLNYSIRNKFVTGISRDNQSNLVVTTTENGFYIYNFSNGVFQNFNQHNSRLSCPYIRSVLVDSRNNYWIGHLYGLQLFNTRSRTFKKLDVPEPNNGVVSLLEMDGKIFAGTDRQGIVIFSPDGHVIKNILKGGINITRLIKLNETEILFSSYNIGLYILNTKTFQIRSAGSLISKVRGNEFVITMCKSSDDVVWIGTYNFGLIRFDYKKNDIKTFGINNGLPSNDIVGIEEDREGNIWLSTSYGLAKFNPRDSVIQTFFINDGINNYQFHEKSSFKDKNGIIYFGGNLGLTYFDPNELNVEKSYPPEMILEKLYILNSPVKAGDKGRILKQALPFTKEITLTHKDKLFSIDFVALDFVSSGTLQYHYMLQGFDKDWYNVGSQRKVTYSNLSRGTYVFKVKAKNGSGVWSSNQVELIIRVKPAPWFSYGAWVCYFVIFSGLIYFISNLRIKAVLYEKELHFEQNEHQREREIQEMKQKFFTNISHELRTPLTMINGMVGQLSKQENLMSPVRVIIQSLELSVDRLLKLINQLLAFKKMESETLGLWLENLSIGKAIVNLLHPFRVFAREKGISLEFVEDIDYTIYFDVDKLEKIVGNLLSNSIKHTRDGGKIEISFGKIELKDALDRYPDLKAANSSLSPHYIEIAVSDTGIGIKDIYRNTIFDRYQKIESEGKSKPDYSNTGIGLNFTKSLVELHKGSIRLTSNDGEGSVFYFILPFDSGVYEEKDFAVIRNKSIADKVIVNLNSNAEPVINKDLSKSILIVEDDPDLNFYLKDVLSHYYNVQNCFDGNEAMAAIKKDLPDIILADVMMPGLNGLELTKKLKENTEYCHVPLILLTAKNETASQIEGLQTGADAYIPKPFNLDYLLVVIENQLKSRKRIQELFLNGLMPNLNKNEANQLDIKFLARFNSILEKEISNTDLDIAFLADSLNMSRSSFYRKFLNLTSLSPISYLRKFRINKSIEIMGSGSYSLREISDMVGFGSYSYFCTAFKQEKNTTPTDYLNNLKKGIKEFDETTDSKNSDN